MRAGIRQDVARRQSAAGRSRSPAAPPRRRPSKAPSAAWSPTRRPATPRGGPRHPHRHQPDRDHEPGRPVTSSATWHPGSYQVRVLRVGYAPVTRAPPSSRRARPWRSTSPDRRAGAARRDRDHRHRRAAQARDRPTRSRPSTPRSIAEEAPITEFSNLISGRAPGVQVLKSGGTTGTGTRIRIRGSNSVSLSNEPLYYIDGIRMESNADLEHARHRRLRSGLGAGPSRINDLNPDDIENIEIVKGPAAATLYGIQASNGVVRITTKRGARRAAPLEPVRRAGRGVRQQQLPAQLHTAGDRPTIADFDGFCSIQIELDGLCTQTSVQTCTSRSTSRRPGPTRPGFRQQYGANVSGGSDAGDLLRLWRATRTRTGAFRLPQVEEDSVAAVRAAIVPDNQLRPNALEKYEPPGQHRRATCRQTLDLQRLRWASSPATPGSSRTTTAS